MKSGCFLHSLFSLNNKIAFITGAARGNGRAIAEGLLRAGATLIAVDVLKDELEQFSDDMKREGYYFDYYTCDLSQKENILKLFEQIKQKYNRIDILVNNAGITHGSDLLDYPDHFWDKTYNINLRAPYEIMKLVGKMMRAGSGGSIINITSLNSELAFPNNPSYVATKGALKQLTKSFAVDLGNVNIRANNVGPGYMKTEMTKKSWSNIDTRTAIYDKTALGRWGTPEDLVGVVIFLASDASSYITGQDIYVDGGWLIKGL